MVSMFCRYHQGMARFVHYLSRIRNVGRHKRRLAWEQGQPYCAADARPGVSGETSGRIFLWVLLVGSSGNRPHIASARRDTAMLRLSVRERKADARWVFQEQGGSLEPDAGRRTGAGAARRGRIASKCDASGQLIHDRLCCRRAQPPCGPDESKRKPRHIPAVMVSARSCLYPNADAVLAGETLAHSRNTPLVQMTVLRVALPAAARVGGKPLAALAQHSSAAPTSAFAGSPAACSRPASGSVPASA